MLKCDDDDDPMKNENYDPFAGCCVILLGDDDTKNRQSPIQKYSNEPIFEYLEREAGTAMGNPPPTLMILSIFVFSFWLVLHPTEPHHLTN